MAAASSDDRLETLSPMPQVFADCANSVCLRHDAGASVLPLTVLMSPEAMGKGIDGLMGRWGPGDRRAAVSLWAQGYFSRFVRPWLAYGLVHGIWFDPRPERISVVLSPLSTPAKFALQPDVGSMGAVFEVLLTRHLEPLIGLLAEGTGTSVRLHWSNAAFPLHRVFRQATAALSMHGDAAALARLAEVRVLLEAEPFGRMVRIVPPAEGEGEPVLQRRICCLRYRLDGLAKCRSACPIAEG